MADLTGTTLGKYQVISRLGRGGMAEVYRAYQPGMDRYVAVKVMHGHMVEEEGFVERFKKEAQIVGALRHPNIVQVIDFDSQDNVYFMVMEYIQGETLSAMLKQRGALPIRESLTIARKLADAVAYAHQEGMLHRDIKPANVLFTKAGEPVLTDFGIARIMGSTHMTQSGIVLGTPAYMSPEAGRGERVDERSDVYSLGIVLYEMLTGHVPFDADTPYAVIFKHITDPLPSPSTLNPEIGEPVERVVLKSLAKALEDRYQSAGDMRNALDIALSGTPAGAPNLTAPLTAAQAAIPRPGATRPMETPSGTRAAQTPLATEEVRRRSPLPLILGLVALLAIIVVGILALISSQQGQVTPTQTSIAVLGTSTEPTAAALPPVTMTPSASPFTTETTNAVRTETAAAAVVIASDTPAVTGTSVATSTPVPTATHTVAPTATPTPIPPTETPVLPTATPMSVALALPTRQAVTTLVFEDLSDGRREDALTRVAPYREQYPEDPDLKLLEAFALLQFRDDPDKMEAARTDLEDVLTTNPENGAAHFILGLYYQYDPINDPETAAHEYDLAIQHGFAIADVYRARANANRYRDVPKEEVLRDYQRALELEPDNDSILVDRGIMLMYDMLDPLSALKDFEASYALVPAPWKHDLLGVAYLKLDQADDAFALYEQGVRGEMTDQPYYLADGAYVALAAGHLDIAREWAEKALALNPQENDARQLLGLVSAEEGDYLGALAQLDRVVAGGDGQPYLNWQFSHDLKEDRARMLAHLGQNDEAIALYQHVVDESGAWWASPYQALGYLYLDKDETEIAREYFAKALEMATNMHDEAGAAAAEEGLTDVQILEALLEADRLLAADDAQGTVDVLQKIIDQFHPQWPGVYILLGRAQGELGAIDAARDSLNHARDIAEAEGEAEVLPEIEDAERQLVALQPPTGEGSADEQIDALEAYIDNSGTQDVAYFIDLAMLYRSVGDTTAARQTLMRALAITTTTGDADAHAAVLDALQNLNPPAEPPPTDDPEQRIVDLEQYIQDAQPREIHWYLDLAALYRDRGDATQTRRTLMRALAMLTATGNDPDARNVILDALRALNTPTEPPPTDDPDQRIAALEQYIQDAQPNEIRWYVELATLYRDKGDVAEARRTLMRALAMLTTSGNDPDARKAVLDALQNLSETSEVPPPPMRGDDLPAYAGALDTYIKLHQLDNIDLYLELAGVYREMGDSTQARRTLMRALAVITTTGAEDQRPRVLDALSRLNESSEPSAPASLSQRIDALQAHITETSSTDVEEYLELARLYAESERLLFARVTLLNALHMLWGIEAEPELHFRVRDALHQVAAPPFVAQTDDAGLAAMDFGRYIDTWRPSDAAPFIEYAALRQQTHEPEKALWALRRGLQMLTLTGGSADAHRQILDALRQVEVRGGPNASPDLLTRIRDLEAFISVKNPNDAELYLELAAIYRIEGDDDASRRTLTRALNMLDATGNDDPRIRVNEALRSLDVPLESSGPAADADVQIQELERLIDAEQPHDVKPYLELAALYRERGETATARRTLMRALAMLTATDGGPDARNAVMDALNELR